MKTNQPQRHLRSLALALGFTAACGFGQTFTTNSTVAAGDATFDGQSVIVSNCTLTVNGPHSFASLLLTSNATLTCDAAVTGLVVTVTGDFAVETNCAVTVAGQGWTGTDDTGNGPGGGQGARGLDRIGGSGAGHGGEGGLGNSEYAVGTCYGSVTEPVAWGSAGGAGTQYQGAAGGGAVRLIVGRALFNDGSVTANGGDGGAGGWGGAGGSIWITAQTVTGAGSFTANGGNGGSGARGTGGGGGGGRVAFYCETNLFTGTLAAQGGWGNQYGGAGTLYRKLAS